MATLASSLHRSPWKLSDTAMDTGRTIAPTFSPGAVVRKPCAVSALMRVRCERGLTVSLEPGQLIGLEDCIGAEIQVHSGQLWITQADDYRDIIVQGGSCFRLDRSGLTLVSAIQTATLNIKAIDENLLSRLRFD